MGRASEFIDFINRPKLPVKWNETYYYISRTPELMVYRKKYRKEMIKLSKLTKNILTNDEE